MAIFVAAIAYLICGVIQHKRLKSALTLPQSGWLFLLCVAIGCHAYAVVPMFFTPPNAFNFHISLMPSVILLGITLLFGITQHKRLVQPFWLVLGPTNTLALVLATLTPNNFSAAIHTGIAMHVVSSIMAFSLLGLCLALATLTTMTHKRLKRTPKPSSFLPAIETTESLLYHWLALAWLTLTLCIVTGFLYVDDMLAQKIAHKTLFTLLAWCIFTSLLAMHHLKGWRGPRMIRIMNSGFMFCIIAYFGSKFVIEILLV